MSVKGTDVKLNFMNLEEYRQELVKSFHQQFAENQNNHQSAFIQLLSIILTVVVGFSFALLNFGETSTEKSFYFTLFDFTIAFCIAEGILTLGFCLVVSYAYGFRRDQLVNATIREKAEITKESSSPLWQIFPPNYNPKTSFDKKKICKCISWMPDFHAIFAVVFLIMNFLVLVIYLLKIYEAKLLSTSLSIDWHSFSVFIIGALFLLISYWVLCCYFKKIKDLYEVRRKRKLFTQRLEQ